MRPPGLILIVSALLCAMPPHQTEALAPEPEKKSAEKKSAGLEPQGWRPYRDGPLTATDFRGKIPPVPRPSQPGGSDRLTAYTVTEIRYDTRYQISGTPNRWTSKLVAAQAFAVILLDQSWNERPSDAKLMDHEQGHFDLTHVFALAVQRKLDEFIRLPHGLRGSGSTPAEATSNLEARIGDELKPLFDEHIAAQQDYDRATLHGTNSETQRAERKKQSARIAELGGKRLGGKRDDEAGNKQRPRSAFP